MAAKKKLGRPKMKGPKRTVVLSLRLTVGEHRKLKRVAALLPVAIWARLALMRVVDEALAGGAE